MQVPLPLVEKNAGLSLEEWIDDVVARELDQAGMAEYCALYRRMAIAKLFLSGEPTAFFVDLSRSGQALLHFLEGAREEAKITSRCEPFLDAVACGDDALAAAIARAARATWNEDSEYEEDFLYARFLLQHAALRVGDDEQAATLRRWEGVVPEGEDARLTLCQALLSRDQDAFDAALEAFVREKQDELAGRRKEGRLSPDDAPTTAKLSVEVLALLRLADEAGLRTEPHVPLAPSVARRLDLARPAPPGAWRDVSDYDEFD